MHVPSRHTRPSSIPAVLLAGVALGMALLLASPAHATVIGKPVPAGTVSLPYIQWSASANGGLGGWVIVGTYPLSHLGTQSANTVLAGPASGATAASVTARALVPLDIPAGLAGTGLTSTAGVLSVTAPVPTSSSANTVLAAPNGSAGAITARVLVTADLPSQLPASVGVGTAATADGVTVAVTAATASGLTVNLPASTTSSDIYLKNAGANPVIKWDAASNSQGLRFLSGTTEVARFQDNGAAYFAKLGTLSGLNIDNWFIQRGSGPLIALGGGGTDMVALSDPGGGSYLSTIKINIPSSATIGQLIKAASGQTAALLDTTNSTASTHYFQVMPTGHLILGGTAPAAAIGAAASAVTVSTTATDARGVLTCTMIASPTAGQAITTVTFAAAYAAAPVVVISPSSAGAVSAGAYVSAVSTTGFTITEANAGPASGTVAVSYMVLQ